MSETVTPKLVATRGKFARQSWVIERTPLIIGREPDCDIILNEPKISRQHVRLTQTAEGRFQVEDLQSRNGTWVNGVPLKGARLLEDGDELDLARMVTMVFVASEITEPLTPEELHESQRLRLDRNSRRVFIGDREIVPPLSVPQYRLLELLFDANGGICTREEVISAVWPNDSSEGISEQAIDALVRRLRDRISEYAPNHQYIVTVRGHGFRLEQG
ncbi:MAG: FHA domain-containing protein [Anaerolineae bacterium]|nr:FHA domain-containing protein [Anaerolineae bacterium]MDW8299191.1 FHA domain-containing protein [Anaerolineae bacterium]